MAYNAMNGLRTCDRCGSRMPQGASGTGGFSFKYHDLCNKCKDEMKHQKNVEKQLKQNNNASSDSSSESTGISETNWVLIILFLLKWITAYIWGGPYLIYKGVRKLSTEKRQTGILQIVGGIAIIVFLIVVLIVQSLSTSN